MSNPRMFASCAVTVMQLVEVIPVRSAKGTGEGRVWACLRDLMLG